MNNSKIAIDSGFQEENLDRTPWLRQREGELVTIIEAIGRVNESGDWSILKKHIFDGLVETLERKLNLEAKKNDLNSPEIYRLQGQLAWARKYADLQKLNEFFRLELTNIRKQLHGK